MNQGFNTILNFFMRNNKLRTFVFFFLVSSLLWIASQLTKNYYYTFKLPIVYQHLPDAYYKGFLPNDTLLVTIKTSGYQIIKNKISKPELKIDVQKHHLLKSHQWQPVNFKNKIQNLLGNNSQIINLNPKKIPFKIHHVSKKHVPVYPDINLNFKPGFKNTKPAEISPDSIWIYGNKNIIDTIKQLKTRHYDIKNLDRDLDMTLELIKIDGSKYNTDKINYHIPVSEIIEGETEVKLKVKGAPEHFTILLFPEKIKLKYKYFKDHSSVIEPRTFTAIVQYQPKQKYWQPIITTKPDKIFDLHILPNKINYLIKQ